MCSPICFADMFPHIGMQWDEPSDNELQECACSSSNVQESAAPPGSDRELDIDCSQEEDTTENTHGPASSASTNILKPKLKPKSKHKAAPKARFALPALSKPTRPSAPPSPEKLQPEFPSISPQLEKLLLVFWFCTHVLCFCSHVLLQIFCLHVLSQPCSVVPPVPPLPSHCWLVR